MTSIVQLVSDVKTRKVFNFLAAAFANWSSRQEIDRLGLIELCSRGPASPRWVGVDPLAIAEQVDAAIAARADADTCPRLARYLA